MLRSLSIKNFALIEHLDLEFGPGLIVFTGETGAGKSILIEALGFLMGERGSVDWLRSGADKLEVSGTWDRGDFPTELGPGLNFPEATVVLRRELDSGGRSRAWVQGRPVSLNVLLSVSERLADFHGQHEHQTLLKPAMQLDMLDQFGGMALLREKVSAAYKHWKGLESELESLHLSEQERLRRLDLYRFQVQEIDEVRPKPGEEEALVLELPRLKNAARLSALASQAYEELYEQEGSAEEILSRSARTLEEMARLDPTLSESLAALARSRELVAETASQLSRYGEQTEARPERLDEILARQDRLERLKRKYGATIGEILAYRERICGEVQGLENHEERLREVEKARVESEIALKRLCEQMHEARIKAAKKLSDKVTAELKDLGMASARFSISLEMEENQYSTTGSDRIEFLIAPNPGEGLKSLRAIASGGELSRIMLALKTLAGQDQVKLLVFDEIDSGVGAVVGRSVGEKLAGLGLFRQVFCVTHLPQVACFAQAHFHVKKYVSQGRTRINVERLSGELRLEAIARMLDGRTMTETSRRHAKELLESSL